MLQRVVAPLVHAIGDLWRDGTITAAEVNLAYAAGAFTGYGRVSMPSVIRSSRRAAASWLQFSPAAPTR